MRPRSTVAGKADETYGGTVEQQTRAAHRRRDRGLPTNAPARIETLVRRFARDFEGRLGLPYQMLTATAATLKLGERHQAIAALLVVHEFVNGRRTDGRLAADDRKVRANGVTLDAFVRALSGGAIDHGSQPQIVGPIIIDAPTLFYIGKMDLANDPVPSRRDDVQLGRY
jgi:hypothetical protein